MNRLLCTIVMLTLSIFDCSMGPGGGSEISNGLLLNSNGIPMANFTFKAYPIDYSPTWRLDDVLTLRTDSSGHFATDLGSGIYNILFTDTGSATGAIVANVKNGEKIDTVTLENLGKIQGEISNQNSSPLSPDLIVFIRGTPFSYKIPMLQSTFTLSDVPKGEYRLAYTKTSVGVCPPPNHCPPKPDSTFTYGSEDFTLQEGETRSANIIIEK